MYDILELNNKLVAELKDIAKELEVKGFEKLKKQDLVYQILDQQAINPPQKEAAPKAEKPKPVTKEKKENKEKPEAASTKTTEEAPRRPRKRSEVLKELGRTENPPVKKETPKMQDSLRMLKNRTTKAQLLLPKEINVKNIRIENKIINRKNRFSTLTVK